MNSPVIIEDYDPRWPDHFEVLRSRIASVLGPLAAAIEHVGSTAIPGLAAKPIIDVDILMRTPSDLAAVIKRLESLGYGYRGDLGVPGREAFRAPAGEIPHHLYVCPPESREFYRHVAFRDYLRAHTDDAKAYATLKRELAERFRTEREAYNQAKSEFVEGILLRAQAPVTEHSSATERTIP